MSVEFPIHLPVKEVARAALKAHAEGRLGYQNVHGATSGCFFHYAPLLTAGRCDVVCAVGAYLTDEQATALDGEAGSCCVSAALDLDLVASDAPEVLRKIQWRHDELQGCVTEDGEAAFLAFLRKVASGESDA